MLQRLSKSHVAPRIQRYALPVILVVSSTFVQLRRSPTHSLLSTTIAAILVWLFTSLRVGFRGSFVRSQKQKVCWIAGGLLAIDQLCQRASGLRSGLWWTQGIIPLCIAIAQSSGRISLSGTISPNAFTAPNHCMGTLCNAQPRIPYTMLMTFSSLLASQGLFVSPENTVIGICSMICFTAAILIFSQPCCGDNIELMETYEAANEFSDEKHAFQIASHSIDKDVRNAAIRDTAAALALACGIASVAFEKSAVFATHALTIDSTHAVLALSQALRLYSLLSLTMRSGPYVTALMLLGAALCANVYNNPFLPTLIFSIFSIISCSISIRKPVTDVALYLVESPRRWQHLVSTVAMTCFGGLAVFSVLPQFRYLGVNSIISDAALNDKASFLSQGILQLRLPVGNVHPIEQLISASQINFEDMQTRQSKTLADAVLAYQQRYNTVPPPKFDKWYEFARSRNVQIIDDYDTIYHSVLPFWALPAAQTRARVKEAIGYEDNNLIAVLIRDGEVVQVKGGLRWQQEALQGLLGNFVHFLPDMDLAFNGHDEPRIVVPHDELSQMVEKARNTLTKIQSNGQIRNTFSRSSEGIGDGLRIDEVKESRFNEYAHQNTWIPSRLSCAPDSPARNFLEDMPDESESFALGELGFIYNATAFSDVCRAPSMKGSHAFFDRPNAFNVAHELIPIFSESKISSFQDIVYPSLWHWYGKLYVNRTSDMHIWNKEMYDSTTDMEWEQKSNSLWWRGSTTGGFSREGGWRRHHRQRIVQRLNGLDSVKILEKRGQEKVARWEVEKKSRKEFQDLVDVRFSGVGQCDKGDCHAQEEYFDIAPYSNISETWRHRHVLDMDGNAFSARFYALMRSKSLVYKMAVFREWHEEWLKPWRHYIPMSLKGDEHLETLRYFAEDVNGQVLAEQLAKGKREWAQKVLRREDMEAWFFRLLLEYGRVIDDERGSIGYPG